MIHGRAGWSGIPRRLSRRNRYILVSFQILKKHLVGGTAPAAPWGVTPLQGAIFWWRAQESNLRDGYFSDSFYSADLAFPATPLVGARLLYAISPLSKR